MRIIALLILCIMTLGGCQTLIGQNSITASEFIQIMDAHNANGCIYIVGAYPPFGQAKIVATWGDNPPDYCKPF